MSKEIIYTIRKVGSDHEQNVCGYPWSTLEAVWHSQMCWYTPGSRVIVTNTETGEYKEFIRN